MLRLTGPGGESALILVQTKASLEPQHVKDLVRGRELGSASPILMLVPFLSPRTQQRLRDAGFNYADLTGNVHLSLSKPALFIDARGADENPEPMTRERRSLKGAKAGRLVRALCDFTPPVGLRELARRAAIDAGYASRVVQFLEREAIVVRTGRGPITEIDWPALIRRWSEQYSPFKRGRVAWYLAPRGLQPVVDTLETLRGGYVVTGSWAANLLAPVAPARLLLCYADDVDRLAKKLDLRAADAGMNVALVQPFDDIVMDRTSDRDGLKIAAASQIAADLLTSPARGPNEAEALIEWMRENERVWRIGCPSDTAIVRPAGYDRSMVPSSLLERRQDILDLAARHGARNVRVFGSFARGDQRVDSDVDLLVDVEAGRTLLDVIGLEQDLEQLLGRKVDVQTEGGLSPYLHERILAEALTL